VAGAVLRTRAGLSVPVRNTIRDARLTRALTQEQLAQACEVTRQTIIALEAGKYSPSLELAFRLARALGRDLEEIFRFEEKI
jgi:putative transcriptional regulator